MPRLDSRRGGSGSEGEALGGFSHDKGDQQCISLRNCADYVIERRCRFTGVR
jgi:hypothetical protein